MPISIWSKSNFEELLGIGITNRHGEDSLSLALSLQHCMTQTKRLIQSPIMDHIVISLIYMGV